MGLNAFARVPAWLGLFVAMATALLFLAPRTSPTAVAPRAAAEDDLRRAWQSALDTMDRALAAGDISGAEMAWRNAYGLAIRSRQWQAFLAAGDGSLRISDHVLVKQPYRARAREAWRAALFLARAQHSVDGVLGVAEAFARLGDAEALTQALRIADSLAGADVTGEAQRHVLEVRRRLTPSTALSDPVLALFLDAAVRP